MKGARGLATLILLLSHPLYVGAAILEARLLQTVEGFFSDVAVDRDGRFYLLDAERATVLVMKAEQSVPLVEFDLLDVAGKSVRDASSLCILRGGGMAVLDEGDRKVVLYGADGLPRSEFPLGDSRPQAIARDTFGRLLVLDQQGRILVFGEDGLFLGVLGKGAGEGRFFTTPQAVACDTHGNTFVLEGEGGQFRVLNPLGQAKATPLDREEGLPFLKDPRDVYVDDAGFVYVADAELDRCLVYSADGFVGTFGAEGVGEGRFREPVCVASDGAGTVAIGDAANKVAQFFVVPELERSPGSPLQNWLLPPIARELERVEDVWSAASWSGEQWAVISDGRLLTTPAPGGDVFAEAGGKELRRLSRRSRVGWDTLGSVWVADPDRGAVWIWSPPAGAPRRVALPEDSFRPVDVALAPWGDIVVADAKEARLALFDPTGVWSSWLGPSRVGKPVGIAFAPDTTLWVGLEDGSLLALGPGGGVTKQIVLEKGVIEKPRDVEVDVGGNLLILGESTLLVLDPDDGSRFSVGGDKRGTVRWRDPTSLALGPKDTLWVFEPSEERVVALGFENIITGALSGAVSPAREATVWAVLDGERVASTDIVPPDGSFSIGGLLPGTYTIDVEGSGLIPLTGLGRASVVPGRIWDVGSWELTVAASVVGKLVPGKEGIAVALAGDEQFVAVTAEGGGFHLRGLPSGSYRLEIEEKGFLPYRSAEFSVGVGESLWVGEVKLVSAGSIEVAVEAPGAEEVWANLWQQGYGWESHSGSPGEALTLGSLAPGVYRLVVTAQGFWPDSSTAEVRLAEGERKILARLQLTALAASSGGLSERVDTGVRAYERADFPSAVSRLERAVASDQLSFDDRARALLYLGLAAVALDNGEAATAAFRELHLISPGCTLPPEYSSTRLETVFGRANPFR